MSKDHWGNIKGRGAIYRFCTVIFTIILPCMVIHEPKFSKAILPMKTHQSRYPLSWRSMKTLWPLICFGLRERNFFNKGMYSFRKICYSELISFNSTRWRDGTLREEVVLIAAAAKAAPTLVSWGTASSCFTKGTGSRSGLKRSMKCVSTSPAAKAWWFANLLRNPILVGKPEIW